MSIKLKQAILANKVSVESKQSGESLVWYRDREGKRRTVVVGGFKKTELAPKLTEAKLLVYSNLETLVKQRAIRIIAGQ